MGILDFFKVEHSIQSLKFNQIYNTYRTLMFHVAREILGNDQDTEDAVQQAFLSIYKNIDKISEIQCPKTRSFIVIIVERKAIDILRKKKRESHLELDEDIVGVSIPLPGDHGLADALARLPARYREILLLRYDNGFTTKELTQLLDMSYDAVQKTISRAKEALRKELEQENIAL